MPLDEDGLMNGKTCQKHTMTQLFFPTGIPSLPVSQSLSHITFPWHICYATKMKYTFRTVHVFLWSCCTTTSANNSCFKHKILFSVFVSSHFLQWFLCHFIMPSNVYSILFVSRTTCRIIRLFIDFFSVRARGRKQERVGWKVLRLTFNSWLVRVYAVIWTDLN